MAPDTRVRSRGLRARAEQSNAYGLSCVIAVPRDGNNARRNAKGARHGHPLAEDGRRCKRHCAPSTPNAVAAGDRPSRQVAAAPHPKSRSPPKTPCRTACISHQASRDCFDADQQGQICAARDDRPRRAGGRRSACEARSLEYFELDASAFALSSELALRHTRGEISLWPPSPAWAILAAASVDRLRLAGHTATPFSPAQCPAQ